MNFRILWICFSLLPFLIESSAKSRTFPFNSCQRLAISLVLEPIPRGGGSYFIPGGYNPFGYKITKLGEEFLKFEGSLDSDVGRLLASLKSGRKRFSSIKSQWLEVMRASKSGQSMRIYRTLKELLEFCVRAGLVD